MKVINKVFVMLMLAGGLLFAGQAKAQEGTINYSSKYYGKLSWDMALPIADTEDYIPNFSARGIEAEVGKYIGSNLSLGFSIGWNVFYGKNPVQGEYPIKGGGTVFGTPFKYINSVPMLVKGTYYHKPPSSSGFVPYLILGLGTTFQKQVTDFSTFSVKQQGMMFTIAPEVGVLYNVNQVSNINFGVRYSNSFATKNVNQLSYIGFNLAYTYNF